MGVVVRDKQQGKVYIYEKGAGSIIRVRVCCV
jgi:hypothetical protein